MRLPDKAFVLAAGFGTRLKPLTDHLPKPAWPFFGLPMLIHTLIQLKEGGMSEAIVNLHHLPEKLREAVAPHLPEGLKVIWSHEPVILGTAGALYPWLERLGGGPFWLVNADTHRTIDFAAMARFHAQRGARATLSVAPLPRGEKGPIAVDTEGRVVGFLNSNIRGEPTGTQYQFTGVHLLESEVLKEIEALGPGNRCINSGVHLPAFGDGKPLWGYQCEGFWSDLGTPESYLAAHRALLASGDIPAGAVGRFVGEEEELDGGGRILPPSFLGEDVSGGMGSIVGPYAVVGRGVRLRENVTIRDCVVWDGVEVEENCEKAIVTGYGEIIIES